MLVEKSINAFRGLRNSLREMHTKICLSKREATQRGIMAEAPGISNLNGGGLNLLSEKCVQLILLYFSFPSTIRNNTMVIKSHLSNVFIKLSFVLVTNCLETRNREIIKTLVYLTFSI